MKSRRYVPESGQRMNRCDTPAMKCKAESQRRRRMKDLVSGVESRCI